MVVDGGGKVHLCVLLTNDEAIEVFVELFGRRNVVHARRFALVDFLRRFILVAEVDFRLRFEIHFANFTMLTKKYMNSLKSLK